MEIQYFKLYYAWEPFFEVLRVTFFEFNHFWWNYKKIGKIDKLGFFQLFDKRVGVVSWYGQNTNIFAHLLHLDNVRLLYFLQNHIFRLKSSEKYWKSNCLLQVNFENRNRVNWHQLMFYIKWWVFVIIKMPCFHIYNIFKCHFKPNQKCQRDMNDPVPLTFVYFVYYGFLLLYMLFSLVFWLGF